MGQPIEVKLEAAKRRLEVQKALDETIAWLGDANISVDKIFGSVQSLLKIRWIDAKLSYIADVHYRKVTVQEYEKIIENLEREHNGREKL